MHKNNKNTYTKEKGVRKKILRGKKYDIKG